MILKSDKDITVYYNLKHLQWSLTTSTDKINTFADKSEVSPYEYLLNPQGFFYHTENQLSSTICKEIVTHFLKTIFSNNKK